MGQELEAHGGEEESALPGWWQNIAQYVMPAVHAVEGAAHSPMFGPVSEYAEQAMHWLGPAARYVPALGAGVGGAHAVMEACEAAADPAHRWDHIGESVLGATSAGLSIASVLAPEAAFPAMAMQGFGELALNTAGSAAGDLFGDDYRFSAGSVVGGVLHAGYDAFDWLTHEQAPASYGPPPGQAGAPPGHGVTAPPPAQHSTPTRPAAAAPAAAASPAASSSWWW